MKIINAPDFKSLDNIDGVSVFLAGGISKCPDWQNELIKMINVSDDKLIIMNPRRANLDISKKGKEAETQIKWEYQALELADIVIFWFPNESLCPITLFEYGKHLQYRNKDQLLLGIDPEYERKFDLEIQTKLTDKNIPIVYSLKDIADFIKGNYERLEII